MKKLLLAFFVVSLFGCENNDEQITPAQVRFQNVSNSCIPYGMRVGDAEYNGKLNEDQITAYYETDPGKYSIQTKYDDGQWISTEYSCTVEEGHKYTTILSNWFCYYDCVQDE